MIWNLFEGRYRLMVVTPVIYHEVRGFGLSKRDGGSWRAGEPSTRWYQITGRVATPRGQLFSG